MLFDKLTAPRLLIEAELRPIQGSRFQPTGFPGLGAATYRGSSGEEMLLVESVQSMANRMESVCWDPVGDDLINLLKGIPYIRVFNPQGLFLTASPLEAHRMNSPYIMEAQTADHTPFLDIVKSRLEATAVTLPTVSELAALLAYYDLNSLIHGVFFAQKSLYGGRLRIPRILSGFVEAQDVSVAMSGGVKLDQVDPKGDSATGRGHVPFSREEFTAAKMTAYFNLDLMEIRGFRLSPYLNDLLLTLSLFKIREVLARGLRFRTACDLDLVSLRVTQPAGFELPDLPILEEMVPQLIEAAAATGALQDPAVTPLTYHKATKES